MAKKPAADTDALVTAALLTVATAPRPPRLAGKGDPAPLFASKTGKIKAVIDALAGGDRPFVTLVADGKEEVVRLTAAGFDRVRPGLTVEQVGPAAKAVAAGLTLAERVSFLQEVVGRTPDAAAELLPEYEAAVAAEKAEAEERAREAARRREREAKAKEALTRWLALSEERRTHRIEALLAVLRAEGWTPPTGSEPTGRVEPDRPREEPRPLVRPTTTADGNFRRDAAERLVSSWRDAVRLGKDEARQFLETALDNLVGVRRIGEEGEQAAFDGAVHEAVAGVFTADPVRVTRSGWALEEDADREYVIQKAQVARV